MTGRWVFVHVRDPSLKETKKVLIEIERKVVTKRVTPVKMD